MVSKPSCAVRFLLADSHLASRNRFLNVKNTTQSAKQFYVDSYKNRGILVSYITVNKIPDQYNLKPYLTHIHIKYDLQSVSLQILYITNNGHSNKRHKVPICSYEHSKYLYSRSTPYNMVKRSKHIHASRTASVNAFATAFAICLSSLNVLVM